jgi:SNF2 family DNA or RNA helicase
MHIGTVLLTVHNLFSSPFLLQSQASEVGMGKTLICIALVLANPGSYKRMSVAKFKKSTVPLTTKKFDPNGEKKSEQKEKKKLNKQFNAKICQAVCENDLEKQLYKVKTTVISTSNTIVGQWYDEIKKFAPNINIKVHHGSYKSSPDYFNPSVTDIQDVDSKYNKYCLCVLHF